MGAGQDETGTAVERAYDAKAVAERAVADEADPESAAMGCSGPATAAVLLLVGCADRDRVAAGPLSDTVARAIALALGALGLPADAVAAIATRAPGAERGSPGSARRLALSIESCDPAWVIALDQAAAGDAGAILGGAVLRAGSPIRVAGRTWLAVDGFADSLTDPVRKRRVWAQLKTLARGAPGS